MNIEKLVDRYSTDLPGFELVGYIEVGAPVFKRTLHCLEISKKPLPVIEEFVLRFTNLEVSKDDIQNVLGIDSNLVSDAWWNLVHKDLIDQYTYKVSETGLKYITENKMDTYEKILLNVCIDGLLGTVVKDRLYMASRSVRDIGLKPLSVLIEHPNVQNINIHQVRQVYRKQKDEEQYEGDLLDIYHVEGDKTQYRRLNILIYWDGANTRLMVYDGNHIISGYEEALVELERRGHQLIKYRYGDYFDRTTKFLETLKIDTNILGPGEIFNKANEMLGRATKNCTISVPLVDMCVITDQWLEVIQRALEKKVKVVILFSGREFPNSYLREQYEKLNRLKKSHTNLVIRQLPNFINKFVISDENDGIISEFAASSVNLPKSKLCVSEYGYQLSEDNISTIKELFVNKKEHHLEVPSISREWVGKQLYIASELINKFDEVLKLENGCGCLADEAIPDLQKLLDSPLATNDVTFKTFINIANQSLVETFERNWKRAGLNRGSSLYFFSEFKDKYPGVQTALHKVKLYRHSTHHLTLEDRYKPTYYGFLDDDLNGRLPQFVPDGYVILQHKIIDSLIKELRAALS